jgi:SAM-dependent methyltransferase
MVEKVEFGPAKLEEEYTGPATTRWGEDIISLLPRSSADDAVCLEFGCGNGKARPIIEHFGYQWVGVDITGDGALAYCDGHFLPFPDETFSLVVSIAVFEHLYDPFRAAREVYRVLKPGGVFIGTTAFLEPFHANSYFHMSHLGVNQILTRADFDLKRLWSTWHYAEALSGFWVPQQASVLHKIFAWGGRWSAKLMLLLRSLGLRFFMNIKGRTPQTIQRRIQREHLTWAGAIGFHAIKHNTESA